MIAYTKSEKKGEMDALLTQLANRLISAGVRPAGIVQVNSARDCDHRCDMDVRVLPSGPLLRISQSLGKESRGCRLDLRVLEAAVFEVERTLDDNVDVFILNKFGKTEADGRGFRSAIAEAVMQGIPVICGVNTQNEKAFTEFTSGAAIQIRPTLEALLAWCESKEILHSTRLDSD